MLIYVRSFVRESVPPVQVCIEQSISITQGQRALREQSENTHRALSALKSESYTRSLKYCVLLVHRSCVVKSLVSRMIKNSN